MQFSLVCSLLVPALLHCAYADTIPQDVHDEEQLTDRTEEDNIDKRDARLPLAEEKAMFKRHVDGYDLNKDGLIDQSEAEKVFEKRTASNILSHADEDGDNTVSVDEFVDLLQTLTEQGVDDEDSF